jgi:hypothetical protein
MSARPGPSGGYHAQWYPYRDLIDPVTGSFECFDLNQLDNSLIKSGIKEQWLRKKTRKLSVCADS